MGFGESLTVSDKIRDKVSVWLNNPPDYHDVQEAYKQLGNQRKQIRLMKRDIEIEEDRIKSEADKPRSNDTKAEIFKATARLRNILANYEADLEEMETRVKFLEYAKSMYASASYQSRILYE